MRIDPLHLQRKVSIVILFDIPKNGSQEEPEHESLEKWFRRMCQFLSRTRLIRAERAGGAGTTNVELILTENRAKRCEARSKVRSSARVQNGSHSERLINADRPYNYLDLITKLYVFTKSFGIMHIAYL